MEKQATRDAYGQALVELGQAYDDVVVLDADLSKSTKTADFAKAFPERFFNAGIAEQNMMGMAAGMAASGKVPFASSFAIFATGRAFEQVRNSIAYPHLNVKVCATHAGLTVGEDGGSHQAIEDIAVMRSLPNMTVVVPADGVSTRKMMQNLYHREGPAYLRLGRPSVPIIYDEKDQIEIGKGNLLREGNDE
jgi:transketolase